MIFNINLNKNQKYNNIFRTIQYNNDTFVILIILVY